MTITEVITEGLATNGVEFTITKKQGQAPRVYVDPMTDADLRAEAMLEIYKLIISDL
jgi:hypothetical protein